MQICTDELWVCFGYFLACIIQESLMNLMSSTNGKLMRKFLTIQNPNHTWYTEQPKLTRCLSQVGFTITPSLLFFFLSLFELKFIFDSKNNKIRHNNYNATRFLICLFAIYSNLSLLIDYMISNSQNDSLTFVDLIGLVVKFLASVCILIQL